MKKRKKNNKTKAKVTSKHKGSISMPTEFEEDRSMKIRMKPQPHIKQSKKL
jgi:hypothetical protein